MSGRRAKQDRTEEAAEIIQAQVTAATGELEPLFQAIIARLKAQDEQLQDLERRLAIQEGKPQSRLIHLPGSTP